MTDNVIIRAIKAGAVVDTRVGHNVWVSRGDAYLASLVCYAAVGVPETNYRIRYMGFGIGGVLQNSPYATAAPLVTSYPAGSDPNATGGNSYNKKFPIDPLITTLERPVRITGGTDPYASAPGTDVWLVDTPAFFSTHITTTSVSFHGVLDGPGGDVAYGPFSVVPLSEVGLFLDEPSVDINTPFSTLVAYFDFLPIPVDPDTTLECTWTVRF